MRTKPRHLPTRIATGAYILNSGISKLDADAEMAKRLHSTAAGAYPMFQDMDPQFFTKLLAVGEIVLGAALLLPIVPSRVAGLGLGAFSGGLVGLYMKTPGMREQDSIRPSQDGMALAKDSWLLGIALSLVMDRQGRSSRKRKRN
jgi:hypothetical protein